MHDNNAGRRNTSGYLVRCFACDRGFRKETLHPKHGQEPVYYICPRCVEIGRERPWREHIPL